MKKGSPEGYYAETSEEALAQLVFGENGRILVTCGRGVESHTQK